MRSIGVGTDHGVIFGLALRPKLENFLEALTPVLDRLVSGEKAQFQVSSQDAFSLNVRGDDGFNYGFEPSKISIDFNHSIRAKPVSGGLPEVEMLSRPRPYTELLEEIAKKLKEVAVVVPANRTRRISRVGIVTRTLVDEQEAPPGIGRFVEYVGRPWKVTSPQSYQFQIVTTIAEDAKWTDRCVHNLVKPEEPDALLNITLDWQRTLKTPQAISAMTLDELLKPARVDALKYFEDVAEGSRFDENVFGTTA